MATQYDNYGGFLVPGSTGSGSSGGGIGGGGGGATGTTGKELQNLADVTLDNPADGIISMNKPEPVSVATPTVPTPSVISTDQTRQQLQNELAGMESDLKKIQATYLSEQAKKAEAAKSAAVTDKMNEKPLQITLSDAERKNLFGNDVTGMTQTPDGRWTMDQSYYNERMGISTAPGVLTPVPTLMETDPEYNNLKTQLDKLGTDIDDANNSLIQSIKDMTASAVASQETANKAFEGGTFTAGIVSGRARYAPEIQGAIQASAVASGIQRVNDLKQKGNQLIAEAMQARNEQQFKVLSKKMDEYRANKKEMRDQLIETQKLAMDMDKNAREAAKMAREEQQAQLEMIAPSLSESLRGITDPEEQSQFIVDYANRIGIDPAKLDSFMIKYKNDADKEIRSSLGELATNYPDSGVTMNDILDADFGTVLDKVMNSRSYQLGNELTKAKINESLAAAAKAWKSANGQDELLSGLDYWAEQMATTGALPAGAPAEIKANVGLVQALAKQVELPGGTVVDATTGFKKKLAAKTEDAFSAGNAILGQLPELRDALKQIYTFPAGGAIKGAAGLVGLKSVAQERFDTIVSNLTSQLALARSGQAVSESEYQRLLNLLPKTGTWKGYNVERLYNFENGLRAELTSRLNANGARINGVDTRPDTAVKAEDGQFVQPGQMLVRELETGNVGIIPADEYDEETYRLLIEK